MCHRRTDWSRIASKTTESEDEREDENAPEFEEDREVEDDREEDPIPADD